jgi:DNA processing protein
MYLEFESVPDWELAIGSMEEAPATPDDPLLAALGHDPTTLDALGARTGWSVQALSARLLELELDGPVRRLPGGLYQRHGRA